MTPQYKYTKGYQAQLIKQEIKQIEKHGYQKPKPKPICTQCNKPITTDEPYTYFFSKIMHINPCYFLAVEKKQKGEKI